MAAEESNQSTLVLLSGGVDSALLLDLSIKADSSTAAMFVDYGQKSATSERTAASKIASRSGVELIDCSVVLPIPSSTFEVPGRNALLIGLGHMALGNRPGSIAIGIHDGTGYGDCSSDFVKAVQASLDAQSGGAITLLAPFVEWSKNEVYDLALASGINLSITHSCETGTSPCGRCPSCLDRKALDARK